MQQVIPHQPIDLVLDMQWAKVLNKLKKDFSKEEMDMEAVLMLIGIQELGLIQSKYTKEQKQDLIHVAVCSLMAQEGFFVFESKDQDGWPHYTPQAKLKDLDAESQEQVLKKCIVTYFTENQYL